MPSAKKKSASKPTAPVKPVAPEPPPPAPTPAPIVAAKVDDRPVIYDHLEIVEYSTTSPKGPLYPDDWKVILGWETEPEFRARKCAENPGTKPEAWQFGDIFHCRNLAGDKVRCNNNAHNRFFDEGWCKALISTIMHGQWAGPHTVPGETVNGETVRISRHGEVLSGQHQGTACILADEFLQRDRANKVDTPEQPKWPAWLGQDHVFIETIVVRGMSSDPRVLMSVDYNKPRTAADVFYTSEVFRDSTPPERKELCKMLASAADMLWTRTDARGYRTHPEVVAFLERHRRLMDCVLHVNAENRENRGISKLRLQPGQCSALMYLMACSGPKTDGDDYRNEEPAPSEKNLDWSLWDRAEEFWTLLAGGKDFSVVRQALGRLVESAPNKDDNQGMGGRGPEKLAVLAKAWDVWKEHTGRGAAFDLSDLEPGGALHLEYNNLDDRGNRLPDGQIKLLDVADFYGIDCPEVAESRRGPSDAPPDPPMASQEEIEKAAEEARARRTKK